MKKFYVLVLLLGVGVTVGCGHNFSASANGRGHRNRDFGKKVAGSYLVEEKEWPTASGKALSGQGVVTFGADGTFLGEFTPDFGADHPARFKSGKHGTWEQTGLRELTLTILGFDYGQEEDNPIPAFGSENRCGSAGSQCEAQHWSFPSFCYGKTHPCVALTSIRRSLYQEMSVPAKYSVRVVE